MTRNTLLSFRDRSSAGIALRSMATLAGLWLTPFAWSQNAAPTEAPADTTVMLAARAASPSDRLDTPPFSTSSVPDQPLPDAPSTHLAPVDPSQSDLPNSALMGESQSTTPDRPIERRYTKYIRPGYRAQPLSVREKVILGVRDSYSLGDFGATILAAGYSHVTNSQPNFGTDSGAFGQRVGAAALREVTEGIFTDSVFSVLEKEDPRYYVLGPKYGYIHRTLYAITRPLITRTDSGNSSPNGALLSGYAASAALALTYYPSENRNFHDAASNFGGSIGGAALGFFVDEFQNDLLVALHLRPKP